MQEEIERDIDRGKFESWENLQGMRQSLLLLGNCRIVRYQIMAEKAPKYIKYS